MPRLNVSSVIGMPGVPGGEGRFLRCGERVGEYTVTGFLGAGGTAEVWCARGDDGRTVALKAVQSDDPVHRERFLAELRILASIHHPGVAEVFASGARDHLLWFAMELLEPLPESAPERMVRRWALQVCEAVSELHRHGILHRDIKRANVMLRGRHAVVTDFGIAKPMDEETSRALMTLTHPTTVSGSAPAGLGTPGRSAPEQFDGARLSAASDVYAIGMLVRDLLPDWQRYPHWTTILSKTLNADPALRYPTPAALGRAIARAGQRRLLTSVLRWSLPLLAAAAVFAYEPCRRMLTQREWQFARAWFETRRAVSLQPRTVYSGLLLRAPVTEVGLPENPGGTVWLGSLRFADRERAQRLILHSLTGEPVLAVGNIVQHHDPGQNEIVLVGNVDLHCADMHGFVRYPTPAFRDYLGLPFRETWVNHVVPVAPEPPVRVRHVATLEEARALPPLPEAENPAAERAEGVAIPEAEVRLETAATEIGREAVLGADTVYADLVMTEPVCLLQLPQNRTGTVWLQVRETASSESGGCLMLWNPGPGALRVVGSFDFLSRPMTVALIGDIVLHDTCASGMVRVTRARAAEPFDPAWIERDSSRKAPGYTLSRSATVAGAQALARQVAR